MWPDCPHLDRPSGCQLCLWRKKMYTAKLHVGHLAWSLCSAGYAGFSGAVSEGRAPASTACFDPAWVWVTSVSLTMHLGKQGRPALARPMPAASWPLEGSVFLSEAWRGPTCGSVSLPLLPGRSVKVKLVHCGHLAGSASRVWDSQSRGCEFKPHTGYTAYLKQTNRPT